MSVSLQPRRYYPRWGQHDGTTTPLTYRQSPEQQQQQQQNGGGSGIEGSPTRASASTGTGGRGGSGGGGGGDSQGPGEEEVTKAAARPPPRKRFNGLLADRFQHPFDLVRACVHQPLLLWLALGGVPCPRLLCLWLSSVRQIRFSPPSRCCCCSA